MTAERRERYAVALAPCNTLWEHVDAAMAVADEEIRKNGLRIAFDAARKFGETGRENARLHAELEEVTDWAAKSDAEKMTHRATLARVESVLDNAPGWSLAELKRRVRAALKGEQS